MDNKLWLVMDPGGKNFACNFIKNGVSHWMGYHPAIASFEVNDIFWFDAFKRCSENMIFKADGIIIERFISRQANRGVSTEKLCLMIGTIMCIARYQQKEVFAKTSSYWKRRVDYDECIEDSVDVGFLKKDKHFVDTILMWSVVHDREKDYFKFLKKGVKAYEAFRKREARNKAIGKESPAEQERIRAQLRRIWAKKKLLRQKANYAKIN